MNLPVVESIDMNGMKSLVRGGACVCALKGLLSTRLLPRPLCRIPSRRIVSATLIPRVFSCSRLPACDKALEHSILLDVGEPHLLGLGPTANS